MHLRRRLVDNGSETLSTNAGSMVLLNKSDKKLIKYTQGEVLQTLLHDIPWKCIHDHFLLTFSSFLVSLLSHD